MKKILAFSLKQNLLTAIALYLHLWTNHVLSQRAQDKSIGIGIEVVWYSGVVLQVRTQMLPGNPQCTLM